MVIADSESGHYLNVTQEAWDNHFTYTNKNGLHAFHHENGDGVTDFEVYYVDGQITNATIEAITTWKEADDSTVKRSASFIIYGKYTYICYLYALNSSTAKATMYGDYKTYEVGYNFKNLAVFEDLTKANADTPAKYKAYTEGVWSNWKKYFNDGYHANKMKALWQTTLIMFAINFGITIFMGAMMFILTRGKNNPFRVFNFWETQKMAYWAVPTPAILGMVLGFIIKNFAQVTFPLVLGLRVMWLAMRTLRPENATPELVAPYEKPSKEEKVKTVKAKSKKK